MDLQIVPRHAHDIASDLETEVGNLKACVGLMDKALSFGCNDPEQAERAQAQMIFLVSCLSDLQMRFEAITAETYAGIWQEKKEKAA